MLMWKEAGIKVLSPLQTRFGGKAEAMNRLGLSCRASRTPGARSLSAETISAASVNHTDGGGVSDQVDGDADVSLFFLVGPPRVTAREHLLFFCWYRPWTISSMPGFCAASAAR